MLASRCRRLGLPLALLCAEPVSPRSASWRGGRPSRGVQEVFEGIVVGEFMELAVVFITVVASLAIMVVLGNWWAR